MRPDRHLSRKFEILGLTRYKHPAMKNPFSHIDQRVPDLEAGVQFYSVLLPEVGFSRYLGGNQFRVWTTEDGEEPSKPWFGITEDKDHTPNANRIAFWMESREEVDRIAERMKTLGAQNLSGPKEMPEYSNTYYAVFFEDPWGNPLEVVHLTD